MRPRPEELRGFQIRGARGLLNMSVARLARETGISEARLKAAEETVGPIDLPAAKIEAIIDVLARYRVILTKDLSRYGVALDLRAPAT